MTIWSFNKVGSDEEISSIYESVKSGISRFGWSILDRHNLLLPERSEWYSQQAFLLSIQPGDWIVHISTPTYGKCIAAKVVEGYFFDDGIVCEDRCDYRHAFKVDVDSIVEFDRRDPRIPDSVNLQPRSRQQRVHAAEDFISAIDRIKRNDEHVGTPTSRIEHIQADSAKLFAAITESIQSKNRGKELERFFADVLRCIPNVDYVKENGFGWGTDHGADLIVFMKNNFAGIEFENKIVVQVKSFRGDHYDLTAVDQIRSGIEQYDADAGILFTTGDSTQALEDRVAEVATQMNKDIKLIAGIDIAKFVIQYCPEKIFDLGSVK
jgi:hypothetical protein